MLNHSILSLKMTSGLVRLSLVLLAALAQPALASEIANAEKETPVGSKNPSLDTKTDGARTKHDKVKFEVSRYERISRPGEFLTCQIETEFDVSAEYKKDCQGGVDSCQTACRARTLTSFKSSICPESYSPIAGGKYCLLNGVDASIVVGAKQNCHYDSTGSSMNCQCEFGYRFAADLGECTLHLDREGRSPLARGTDCRGQIEVVPGKVVPRSCACPDDYQYSVSHGLCVKLIRNSAFRPNQDESASQKELEKREDKGLSGETFQ